MNDRQKRAESIFQNIKDVPPESRDAFLDQACGDDLELRHKVEELLKHSNGYEEIVPEAVELIEMTSDSAARDQGATESKSPDLNVHRAGTRIGPYKLLQEIGQGGMGLVYMAEQAEPIKRKVALKIIKPGMDSEAVIARFEAERQALALMDHQGIARVFDAGMTSQGRPYFVMELVHGKPISTYCNENRLSLIERLELFVLVCQAIQHAHQKGIIHRDIKPSNVLVCNYDGKPVPKIIDFGVAKAMQQSLTEKTMYTQHGQVIGTLEYMSPEQAGLSQLDVDTRSDVYSLGVLLYELLTGTTPLSKAKLRSAAYDEKLRLIREEEAQRPSTRISESGEALPAIAEQRRSEPRRLGVLIRGDLDWIVLKALDKDRSRRYETANGLARDIQRHLNNEPVEACPPSTAYKLRKLVSKHWAGISIASAFAVVLLLSAIISTWMAFQISKQRDIAEAAEQEASQEEAIATEALVKSEEAQAKTKVALSVARRNEDRANRLLGKAEQLAYAGRLAAAQLALANERRSWFTELVNCRWDLRGWEFDYLVALSGEGKGQGRWLPHGDRVTALATHPKRELVAIGGADSAIKFWELRENTAHMIRELEGHEQQISGLAFTPNGKQLVSSSYDGNIKVWDVATGQPLATFEGAGSQVRCVSIRFDGKLLASGGEDAVVRVWDLDAKKQLFSLPGHADVVRSVDFSPDGSQIISASKDETLKLWDAKEQKEIREFVGHTDLVSGVAFSKDGKLAASSSWDKTVRLWELESGKCIQVFGGHEHLVTCVTFASDDLIVSGGWDGKSRLWSIEKGQHLRDLLDSGQTVACLAKTKNGQIVSGCWDNIAILTDLNQLDRELLRGHEREISAVALSPDGRELISGSAEGVLKIWDMTTRKEVKTLYGPSSNLYRITYSDDGTHFFTTTRTGEGLVWSRKLGQQVKDIRAQAVSPDGKKAVFVEDTSFFKAATLSDVETGEDLQTFDYEGGPIGGISFTNDNAIVAIASRSGQVRIWQASTGIEVHRFEHRARLFDVAFHPDGKYLATVGDGLLRIWDTVSGSLVTTLPCQGMSLLFHPSGDRMFMGTGSDGGGRVTVWDARTWRRLLAMDGHSGGVNALALSKDGKQLISGSSDRDVRVWETRTRFSVKKSTLGRHESRVTAVAQKLDGSYMASGCRDGSVKIWDAKTGLELLSFKAHESPIVGIAIAYESDRVATRSADGKVAIWESASGKRLESLRVADKQESPVGTSGGMPRRVPVAVTKDGVKVACAMRNGGLCIWNTDTNDRQDLELTKDLKITAITYSLDERLLACGTVNHKVVVVSSVDGKLIFEFTGHEQPVIGLSFSFDGSKLLSVSEKALLKVWDMNTHKEIDSRKVSTVSDRPVMGISNLGIGPLAGPIAMAGGRVKITKRKKPKQKREPLTLSVAFSTTGYRAIQGLATLYVNDLPLKAEQNRQGRTIATR